MLELKKEINDPNFWEDNEKAAEVSKKSSDLEEEITSLKNILSEIIEIKEIIQITNEESLLNEIEKKISQIEKRIEKEEFKVFLSGKYDKNGAVLQIFSGAGGVDAEDWVTMLLRMYEKYFFKKEWDAIMIHQSFGEGGGPEGRMGTKSVTLEIKARYAYGLLRREKGVHRLVRISPFSAKSLRHTSFALVEVMPIIDAKERKEIEIKPEEIKIETFRSSGPGGQNVNKRETAVRITHLKTNISVTAQTERSQLKNKEKATSILYSKLFQLKEEEKEKERKEIKGKNLSAAWGNQIRSYVLHPYKLVKDLRTGFEIKDTDKVLDGNLNEFITEEIKKIK